MQAIAWADFDGDGVSDVFVANPFGPSRLLHRSEGGEFSDVTFELGLFDPMRATAALWLRSRELKLPSLLILDAERKLRYFLRSDSGGFVEAPLFPEGQLEEAVKSVTTVDGNGDGWSDLQIWTDSGFYYGEADGAGGFVRLPFSTSVHPEASLAGSGTSNDGQGQAATKNKPLGPLLQGGSSRQVTGNSQSVPPPFGGSQNAQRLNTFYADGVFDQAGIGVLEASSDPVLGMLYPLSQNLYVDPSGNVGIGTTTPQTKLDLFGAFKSNASGGSVAVNEYSGGSVPSAEFKNHQSVNSWVIYPGSANNSTLNLLARNLPAGERGLVAIAGNQSDLADLYVDGDISCAKLETADGIKSNASGGYVTINEYSGGSVPSAEFKSHQADNSWVIHPGSASNSTLYLVARNLPDGERGLVSIAGNQNDLADLFVDGDISCRYFTVRGADLVEGFEVMESDILPGSVVCIDPQNPGRLKMSDEAFDTKVAGVISGAGNVAPGVKMGEGSEIDGPQKVALVGRVYVRCNVEGGPIRPGDRLVTSSVPGEARRVAPGRSADGAVLGKAMTGLTEQSGLVLTLVNLQ
ncbi:MAG: hypothetical protein DWQ01_03035 [Planctomycetota bacterium]|nr:MAG: hypothetical protein DWQ01_03035 [Planctomycetota bacterium]